MEFGLPDNAAEVSYVKTRSLATRTPANFSTLTAAIAGCARSPSSSAARATAATHWRAPERVRSTLARFKWGRSRLLGLAFALAWQVAVPGNDIPRGLSMGEGDDDMGVRRPQR